MISSNLLPCLCKEFVGSDAAAYELKAMRLSKKALFKRIRIRVRDSAHAAGRLLVCLVAFMFESWFVQDYGIWRQLTWEIANEANTEMVARAFLEGYLEYLCLELSIHHQLACVQPSEWTDFPEVCALPWLIVTDQISLACQWLANDESIMCQWHFSDINRMILVIDNASQVKEDIQKVWRTRNLGFAKHRHSSVLKPASRFVLHFGAILHSAMEMLAVECL